MVDPQYDVFFSHVSAEKEEALKIVEALRAEEIKVWVDQDEAKTYEGILKNLSDGLSNSKALVAYYSKEYPKRRYCQWEFTSAFLAGQSEGDPTSRIMVINPERDGHDHIMPIEFQGVLFQRSPNEGDSTKIKELVNNIKNRVSKITTSMGKLITFDKPSWYGRTGVSYPKFVGRLSDMWDIHSKLNSWDAILITGGKTQVQGLGGIGKSLLAEEYGMRFGASYRGGVYWINASAAKTKNPDEALEVQLREIAEEVGIPIESDYSLIQIRGALGRYIKDQENPSLWIVDDLPNGINNDEVRKWFAPHDKAKTLITTRSREYTIAESVNLGILEKEDAYQLITSRKKPNNHAEEESAQEIIKTLGYHALAIDVA